MFTATAEARAGPSRATPDVLAQGVEVEAGLGSGAGAQAEVEDPRARKLFELTELIETDPEPSLVAELARVFNELDAEFAAGARWTPELSDNYCWAAVFLTEPGVPESLLPRGRDATRIRAADLALQVRGDLSFAGRELERKIASELWPRGRAREALTRLDAALEAYSYDPECVAMLACEKGRALLALKDVAGAERALALADDASSGAAFDATTLALMESLRLAVQLELGLPDYAAITLEHETALLAGLGDVALEELLLVDQVNLDLSSEKWQAVTERCRAALDDPSRRFSGATRATLEFQLGCALTEIALADESTEFERAREAFLRALAMGGLTPLSEADLHLRLADVERGRSDLDAAERELRIARDLLDQVGRGSLSGLAQERARLATIASRIARARGADRNELEERAAELERAYGEFLEYWAALPKRRDGVGFLHYGERRAVLCELVGLLVELHGDERGAEEGLELLMRAQALGTFAEHLGGPAPTLDEARARLCTEDRGVLIFLPGPQRSFAFALDRGRQRAAEIAPYREFRPAQRLWNQILSRSPRDETGERALERRAAQIGDYGRQLAGMLLPPTIEEAVASWTSLSIVGLEWIGYMPFEALPFRGEELGLRSAIGYLPSLSVGCLLARRAEARGPESGRRGLRLVGAPLDPPQGVARWEWDEIAWNEARVAELEDLFGSAETRRGEHATLAALRELCDGRGLVLEVMAHGFYDGDRPPPAGFALAESPEHDGLVRVPDLDDLSAPPFVALAVCGSLRGPLRSGDDGVANLGGAFLQAGANAVMVAFVDVEQLPTERLFDAAYREMVATGASPAEALLRARRALASQPATADPFDHAMVHVVGLAFEPLPAKRGVPVVAWIGAAVASALALAAATLWRSRRRSVAFPGSARS